MKPVIVGCWLLMIGCVLGQSMPAHAGGDRDWEAALSRMPLRAGVTELSRTNCVGVMLEGFQSNEVVKALIFMPGATDELYMFRRVKAVVANSSPTLLDAVSALTNQSFIQCTFRPPLLLLHTTEDGLEPLIQVAHRATADKIKGRQFLGHVIYNDRDWDTLQPDLKKRLKIDIRPWRYSYDSWHFYRHSFAAWNLNGWEALEAAALAGKSRYTIRRNQAEFEMDRRVGVVPGRR